MDPDEATRLDIEQHAGTDDGEVFVHAAEHRLGVVLGGDEVQRAEVRHQLRRGQHLEIDALERRRGRFSNRVGGCVIG